MYAEIAATISWSNSSAVPAERKASKAAIPNVNTLDLMVILEFFNLVNCVNGVDHLFRVNIPVVKRLEYVQNDNR